MRKSALFRCLKLGLAVALPACSDDGGWPTPADGLEQESIVGGQADTTSHAVIGIITKEGSLCSGSLILPNLVLTARHCVAALGSESVQCGVSKFGSVYAASDFAISWDDNLRDNIDSNTVYHAKSIKVPTDAGVCGNDIALIELSSNVPADQAVPIVPRVDTPPMPNEVISAVGYGITSPNDQSGSTAGKRMRFNGGKVSCVGTSCRDGEITSSEFDAKLPVCSGDSGGPALDAQGQVIGATSRGPAPCDSAVYSGVSTWKSFIVDGATKAVSDGGYDPPGWVTGMPTSGSGGMSNVGAGGKPGGGGSSGGAGRMSGGAPGSGGAPTAAGGVPSFGGAGGRRGGFGMSGSAGSLTAAGGVPSFGGGGGRGPSAGAAGGSGTAGGSSTAGGSGAAGAAGTPAGAAGMAALGGAGGRPSSGGAPATNAGRAGSDPGTHSGGIDEGVTAPAPGCGCRTTASVASKRVAWWDAFAALCLAAALRRRTRTARVPKQS